MTTGKPINRFPFTRSNLMPPFDRLAERVRDYFDQHPEASPAEFLREAVRKEIYAREHNEMGHRVRFARRASRGKSDGFTARPRPTAQDIQIHVWLAERLAALQHERHGLWPRLRRFLFGNRLVRRLG